MEATGNSSETDRLLQNVAAGDREVWGDLLARHRDRLRAMVALRLDPRLQGRIDPSDVVQEAFLTASVQLDDYLQKPPMPFFLWLRAVTVMEKVRPQRVGEPGALATGGADGSEIPSQLGDYRLIREIGRGGHGGRVRGDPREKRVEYGR